MSDGSPPRETVLVVIPVRNRPRLVRETLDGVLAQTHGPDEVVVVDDGSSDGGATPRSVEAWIREHEPPFPVQLVRREHRGPAAARNAGVRVGRRTDWLCYLDSDDLWPSDFLARCLAASASAPGAIAVTADQRIVDGATGEVSEQDASGLQTAPGNWLLEHEPCLFSCTLFRAALVRARGGLDERLPTGEDLDLVLPLTLEGPWLHAPGSPVVLQRNPDGEEEGSASRRTDDRFLHWARIYDALLARPALRTSVDPALRAERLWDVWYQAGEHRFVAHRRAAARGCFARALRYRPLHRKTWSRWAKCFVPYRASASERNLPGGG